MTASVYTPVYKTLLRFREILIVNKKIFFFRKKKWHVYQSKLRKRRKKIIDQRLFRKPNFNFFFNRSFSYNLVLKQKFSFVYGMLKLKYMKKLLKKSLILDKNCRNQSLSSLSFFKLAETRLDSVLCNSLFCKTLREARNWISSGYVFVDRTLVRSSSSALTVGSRITLKEGKHFMVKSNLLDCMVSRIPFSIYTIDYRVLSVSFALPLSEQTSYEALPFKLEQSKLRYFLKHN